MYDELGTVARQDFLFGGLPLAIVDSLFFLGPLCRQFLIFGRHDRAWRRPDRAVETSDDELGPIARENVLLGCLFLTPGYFLPFLCSLVDHVLILGSNGRSALALSKARRGYHEQRQCDCCGARHEHAQSLSVSKYKPKALRAAISVSSTSTSIGSSFPNAR